MLKARHAATTFLLQMCLPTVLSGFTARSLRAIASQSCRSDSSGQSTGSSDEYQLLYYSDVESKIEKQSEKIRHQQLLTDLKEEMGSEWDAQITSIEIYRQDINASNAFQTFLARPLLYHTFFIFETNE